MNIMETNKITTALNCLNDGIIYPPEAFSEYHKFGLAEVILK